MRICDDLRQAVLQAAIQGKLTTQLPEDGNASDLLKQTIVEKERLIKEKKIKKEKLLPEISPDEIPFDIPENWKWVRLQYICKSITAGGDKPKDFSKEKTEKYSIPVIANGETNKGVMGFTAMPSIIEKAITVSGRGTIGYSVVRTEPFFPIVRLLVLTFIDETTLLEYLQIVLTALMENGIGSAVHQLTVPMISPKAIPLPPLAEQHRIVARVEELMARIDDLEKTETELEKLKAAFPGDMKAALLQAAIQGKLTEQLPEDGDAADLINQIRAVQVKLIEDKKLNKDVLDNTIDDEPPFDIPENWAWICLKGLVCRDIRRGKSPKYGSGKSFAFAQKCNSKYDGIRLDLALSVTDAFADRFTDGDEVQDGDIVINSTGNGTLGRIGYFEDKYNPNGYKYYPDSHVTTVRCLLTNPKYILICLKCYQEYLEGKGEGSTNQKELKPETIKRLMIPLPPLAEQKRIVEKLDKLLPLCDGLVEE